MGIKWKNFSHSLITKIIVFIIVIGCFTGAVTTFINMVKSHSNDLTMIFEDSYYNSKKVINDTSTIINPLTEFMINYKSEENILKGATITEQKIKSEENSLYRDFANNSKSFNEALSDEENYKKFKEEYAEKISKIKDELIKRDLENYKANLSKLKERKGVLYYISDGTKVLTNSDKTNKEYFEGLPCYIIVDKSGEKTYPKEFMRNRKYKLITENINSIQQQKMVMYIGFTNEYINSAVSQWNETKLVINHDFYTISAFLLGFILSLIYLVIVTGRKFFKDKEICLNSLDKMYSDVNIMIFITIILLWFGAAFALGLNGVTVIIEVTAVLSALGLILVLSLVRQFKNNTLLKNSLIYKIGNKLLKFIKKLYNNITRFFKEVYNTRSISVKILLIVIGYPALVTMTFFMFPITIGVAVWLAFKKVKEFNAIKEGIEKVKDGDINHKINLSNNGELGKLAANIDSITGGLNKAVEEQIKSERLKTELITNVSHDIRTPLTSIITYVDLLKKEEDNNKKAEYIEIIEQKADRLKVLTEDLFEASKASSGNMPVNYEKIDVVSLITQGLGELHDKIEELNLEFKVKYPKDKVYIRADGRLFWRVIENLLSNIFKYALKGSRVYVDIEALEKEVLIKIKNISAYELNISAEELMERFKRGDESRSSQGSGLGLSIAKSLVDIQKGEFNIEIDGDLFKAVIEMPREI